MATPLRSIRLVGRTSLALDRASGDSGEMFFDSDNLTLRLYNRGNQSILATQDWVSENGFDGDYNALINKPVLFSGSYADLTNKPLLFDGNYNNLTNKPSIPILPVFSAVATSGSYADLSNKPTIPESVDLTGYATETYVDTSIGSLSSFGNLDGLGFKLGTTVSEFSTDYTMSDNASDAVPVESAVRGYIDRRLGLDHNGSAVATLSLIGSGYLPLSGNLSMTGALNMNSHKITNVTTPTNSGDAANKGYVDGRTVVTSVNGNSGVITSIATLDAEGKLSATQIPTSLTGAVVYKGTWDASTNTPTLSNGVGTAGWEYAVSAAGTVDFGAGGIAFVAGDWVIYNGTIWEKIPSNTVAAAGTLTGTTLASGVVSSSLTSVGTLTNLTVTNTITGSISGNAGTVTNGVVTSGSYSDPSWLTLTAGKVGLGNVTNESKSTMFSGPTLTGTTTVSTVLFAANGFSIVQTGTKLYFKYNGTNVLSIDSSGNIIGAANITAYGTP